MSLAGEAALLLTTRSIGRSPCRDQADLNFGDAQDIAFRITDADLAAARFDRVKLWFQAG